MSKYIVDTQSSDSEHFVDDWLSKGVSSSKRKNKRKRSRCYNFAEEEFDNTYILSISKLSIS